MRNTQDQTQISLDTHLIAQGVTNFNVASKNWSPPYCRAWWFSYLGVEIYCFSLHGWGAQKIVEKERIRWPSAFSRLNWRFFPIILWVQIITTHTYCFKFRKVPLCSREKVHRKWMPEAYITLLGVLSPDTHDPCWNASNWGRFLLTSQEELSLKRKPSG